MVNARKRAKLKGKVKKKGTKRKTTLNNDLERVK
jgi:hypothetical protein